MPSDKNILKKPEKPVVPIVPPKVKKRYTVTVEGMVPVKMELDVWAFDEEEALALIDNPSMVRLRDRPQLDLPRIRKKKVQIKEFLTSLVKLVRNF